MFNGIIIIYEEQTPHSHHPLFASISHVSSPCLPEAIGNIVAHTGHHCHVSWWPLVQVQGSYPGVKIVNSFLGHHGVWNHIKLTLKCGFQDSYESQSTQCRPPPPSSSLPSLDLERRNPHSAHCHGPERVWVSWLFRRIVVSDDSSQDSRPYVFL